MTVFAEDEAAVQRSQNPACGRGPTGGREQAGAGLPREPVGTFGAMSQGGPRIRVAEPANPEAFLEFPEDTRRDRPRLSTVPSSVPCHRPKAARGCAESAGGDAGPESLPPYTPQPNPVETVWRNLKRRPAGRLFRPPDGPRAAVTAILEREAGSRLKGYLVA